MTSQSLLPLAIALTFAASALAPQSAQAQQNTVIQLKYQETAGGPWYTCDFDTSSGLSVSSASAGIVEATGGFDYTGSHCPTGVSNGQDMGAVTINVNSSPGANQIFEAGENASVTWAAPGADACTYGNQMSLPGAVSGWGNSGFACVGESACASGGTSAQGVAFNTAGNYTFQLACIDQEGGETDSDLATLQVATSGGGNPGGGGGGACVATGSGINPSNPPTRVGTAMVTDFPGIDDRPGTDVTQWNPVFGYNIVTGQTLPWPGVQNADPKFIMPSDRFWALEFTVGPAFPFLGTWQGAEGPYGQFATYDTLVTRTANWRFSISTTCGDFEPADDRCWADYTYKQGATLFWAVMPAGQSAGANVCTLHRNQTYYFNVRPTSGCTGLACKVDISSGGNFQGAQGM